MLNDKGEWERFTVISKQIVRLSELEKIVEKLKDEGFKTSVYKKWRIKTFISIILILSEKR